MNKNISYLKNENEILNFFSDFQNEPLFYISYEEYLNIFGLAINNFYLPHINKKIIYGHLDFFNKCYDNLWEYKWAPLVLKFFVNLCKFIKFF